MLWKNRGDRPATRSGGRRRHSAVGESNRETQVPAEDDVLSSTPQENAAQHQAPLTESLPLEPDQQPADSPSADQHYPEPPEASQTPEQNSMPGQSTKNSRFSLLRFRHASDPQLSATFAAGNTTPPASLPSMSLCDGRARPIFESRMLM